MYTEMSKLPRLTRQNKADKTNASLQKHLLCIVSGSIHPTQNIMDILKACENEWAKCMWMSATCAGLRAI